MCVAWIENELTLRPKLPPYERNTIYARTDVDNYAVMNGRVDWSRLCYDKQGSRAGQVW